MKWGFRKQWETHQSINGDKPPESVRQLTMFVEAVCNARKVSAVTETHQDARSSSLSHPALLWQVEVHTERDPKLHVTRNYLGSGQEQRLGAGMVSAR